MRGFPEQVKAKRNAQGISQDALSKRMRVSLRTVQSWEYGTAFPRPHHLEALATALGCHVADLFPKSA